MLQKISIKTAQDHESWATASRISEWWLPLGMQRTAVEANYFLQFTEARRAEKYDKPLNRLAINKHKLWSTGSLSTRVRSSLACVETKIDSILAIIAPANFRFPVLSGRIVPSAPQHRGEVQQEETHHEQHRKSRPSHKTAESSQNTTKDTWPKFQARELHNREGKMFQGGNFSGSTSWVKHCHLLAVVYQKHFILLLKMSLFCWPSIRCKSFVPFRNCSGTPTCFLLSFIFILTVQVTQFFLRMSLLPCAVECEQHNSTNLVLFFFVLFSWQIEISIGNNVNNISTYSRVCERFYFPFVFNVFLHVQI